MRDNDRDIGSPEGVSLESGLGPVGRRGCVIDVSLILDVVECVLRATERIELPEEINGSLGDGDAWCFARLRFNILVLRECWLTASASASRCLLGRTPLCAELRGGVEGDARSSVESSSSGRPQPLFHI